MSRCRDRDGSHPAPAVLVGGTVALPVPGQPPTHILEPPIASFSGTTENEAFAVRLAAAAGLNAAPVELRVGRDRAFLLVEPVRSGSWRRRAAFAASTGRIFARHSPLPRNEKESTFSTSACRSVQSSAVHSGHVPPGCPTSRTIRCGDCSGAKTHSADQRPPRQPNATERLAPHLEWAHASAS